MTTTPSSPTIVGRDSELRTLLSALAEGQAGSPRAVLVRGEAGIGKTRLLQEFVAEASARPQQPPLVATTGQCVDLGPIGAPFTPIRRLLHEMYIAVGDEAFRRAAGTPAVVATLGTLIPEIALDAAPPTGGADYVAEAVERVVENLSDDYHLLLILEDLHWADAATLALLKTLAGTLRGSHLTLVMTYRSDDVGRGHPLRPVLAEFERNRTVISLLVERLALADVAAQAEAIIGRGLADAELHTLQSRSEGVPFFVEELLGRGSADLPETLRDIVLARYDELSPATRRTMRVIAAGGVRVEHELVAAVHPHPAELDEEIREASRANVIVTGETDYCFRHALIQEAVHDELLPSERVQLHTRYATELQRQADAGARTLGAAIAEHWLIARDNAKAFDATVLALAEARAANAPTTAALLGERLLELWPQVPDAAARAGAEQQAIWLDVAQDVYDAGDPARAARVGEAGLQECPPTDAFTRAALLRLVFVLRYNAGERGPSLVALLDEARTLLGEPTTPATQAQLAKVLSTFASTPPYTDEKIALSTEAIDLADSSGDLDALALALINRAISWSEQGRPEDALSDERRAADVAPTPLRRLHSLINLQDSLALAGRFAESAEIGEKARAEAEAAGLARSLGAHVDTNLANALLALGRAGEAVAVLRRSMSLIERELDRHSFALQLLSRHDVWDDRLADAERRYAEHSALIAQAVAMEDDLVSWAMFDIDAALGRRDDEHDPARRAVLSLAAIRRAAVLADVVLVTTSGIRARLIPAAARSVAAAVADGVDDPTVASVLAIIKAELSILPDVERSRSLTQLVRAELAPVTGGFGNGDRPSSIDAWRAAVSELGRGFAPCWELHYSRLRLAEALVAAGEREEASAVVNLIVAEAPGHGCGLVARWAGELASRAGMTLAHASASARRTPEGSGVSSLTPRELQVLALVAQGLTNPQIGERLFISPKTASVHVSAILAKIGAANRAEAAAAYVSSASEEDKRSSAPTQDLEPA